MKKYNIKETEEKIKKFWDKEKIYRFDINKKGKVFSIDTPPPYISGRMHIGHAFSYSQQDFIVRFHRMKENVFYPFGTDDNGLPTERFIEKINNVKSKNMTRADFISLCLKTLKKETPKCIEDFKILGISADYNIYYSTIDNHSRKISQKSFIDLYKDKLIYRTKIPTPWCVDCQTSIAQAELEDKEEKSLFSTIKFKDTNGKDLLIATTRPELLGACVAVFVNPKDKRYKHLIGKKAKVPLFNRDVPIIDDDSADMEKGTGVLMICSYGDRFDVDAINRYKLTPNIILNEDGKINQGDYKGLNIKEARKKILKDLKMKNLIVNQKEITHIVNVHDKCGCEIEFIPTQQWFIKILQNKKKLIEQGKKIKWYPEFMRKRYENWIKGLEWDWSISRNRHFGVPIPVWYCDCGEIILPDKKELPIDPLKEKRKCKCGNYAKGENMVLDTWATSSLTPQIALGLINNKLKLPMSLRPQAHDIIRTWAFYTIVKSLYHENKIPWEDIMVSGYVTLGGKKMSKSKGNVINPLETMEEYGADSLRFAAAGSKLGNDSDYQEKDLITGKKFINKLWNASRFVFMNLKDFNGKKPDKLEKIDELFLKKLDNFINTCTCRFETYDYSKVRENIEKFFWHDFCDNYLEIVKKRIYQNKKGKESAQYVLYDSLLTILKIIAPIMPFVTEEIYQENFRKFEKEKSIHLSSWPKNKGSEEKSYSKLDKLFELIYKIRQEKSNNKKSMNSEIILNLDSKDYNSLKEILEDLKDVANAKEIKKGKFKVEFI